MAVYKNYAEWIDADGNTRLTAWYANDLTGTLSIAINIQALSNAQLLRLTVSSDQKPVSTGPVVAEFVSALDAAQLIYTPTIPGTVQLFIPAPKLFVFAPDTVTVLLASVLLLNSAFTTFGCAADGTPIALFIGGQRIGPKTARLG